MTDIAIQERQSVQFLPDAKKGSGLTELVPYVTVRSEILPIWGTRERERWLRLYYRHPHNWLGQSAFGGLIKKVKSTPWEIKGARRVKYFQEVLQQADFGRGWGSLLSKVVLDFLRQDGGGYIEVIAPGKPDREPVGPITGLAPLDSLRCLPTGDPEFPVIYYNRKGQLHLLHRSRVIQLVDLPDSDEERPGYGLCALSRAITIVTQQIAMNRYVSQKLDDRPKPGFVLAQNISRAKVDEAFQRQQEAMQRDSLPPEGNTVWLFGVDPANPIKLDSFTFASAPEGWSAKEYNELHVNAMAAALGVDVQEIWQLTGGNLGSGQQSQILHLKSQGKTYGDLLTTLERAINKTLPETLDFAFKHHDPQESQLSAATAQTWAGVTTSVGGILSDDEKRRLLANKVEAIQDVITDENGEIVRLDDVDVDEEQETAPDIGNPVDPAQQQTASDTSPVVAGQESAGTVKKAAEPEAQSAPQTQIDPVTPVTPPAPVDTKHTPDDVIKMLRAGVITIGQAQEQLGQPVDPLFADMYMKDGVPVPKEVLTRLYETAFGRGVDTFSNALAAPPATEEKDIQSTRLDFELEFETLMIQRKELSSRSMGARVRSLLRQYGYLAYQDGLTDGGVEDGVLDDDDEAEFVALLAAQNTFVSDFSKAAADLSDALAAGKPAMWYTKSIATFYETGRLSADRNGMYEFVGDDGEESCDTCQRLKDQRHRMKDWTRKKLRPGVDTDNFECRGFNCRHLLKKTTSKARGRF